jgi:hypothetical protein
MTPLLRTGRIEEAQKSRVNRVRALPHDVFTRAIAQVKERYRELKHRYGPRYYKAMLAAALVTFFLPIPGSLLIGVALVVVIAEVHRALSKRGDFSRIAIDPDDEGP